MVLNFQLKYPNIYYCSILEFGVKMVVSHLHAPVSTTGSNLKFLHWQHRSETLLFFSTKKKKKMLNKQWG